MQDGYTAPSRILGSARIHAPLESRNLHSLIRHKRGEPNYGDTKPNSFVPKNGHEQDILRISRIAHLEPFKIKALAKVVPKNQRQSPSDAVNNRSEDSLDH